MVCEKNADCDIDFSKDGLRLRHDDTYIFADGTTLGGDDGIAVAMALAILDSSEIAHPALEAVFTVDEEIGMEGAQGLAFSLREADRLRPHRRPLRAGDQQGPRQREYSARPRAGCAGAEAPGPARVGRGRTEG